MKPNKETNVWKVTTVVLMIVFLSLIIISFLKEQKKEEIINIEGVEFQRADVELIIEQFPEESIVQICKIKENKCFYFSKGSD